MSAKLSRIIIVPGNGCTPIEEANWYLWMKHKLEKELKTVPVICTDMPDPYVARESIWLPFIKNKLGCDENTVLIGHSSGAEAVMRYAETNKIKGLVLVSACWTDLGDANERASGKFKFSNTNDKDFP